MMPARAQVAIEATPSTEDPRDSGRYPWLGVGARQM